MTRKLPSAVAEVTGAARKNPARYRKKTTSTAGEPLGPAPKWLTDEQVTAWDELTAELPWLERPHRGIVGIAAILAARMRTSADTGVQAMNLLRLCLGQLGATPADAHRVTRPAADEEREDRADYFD